LRTFVPEFLSELERDLQAWMGDSRIREDFEVAVFNETNFL
jgi:hypothetical protein